MGRRKLGTLLAVTVAVMTTGCGLDVDAPPSVAEQVAATQPADRKDEVPADDVDTDGDGADADGTDADGADADGADADDGSIDDAEDATAGDAEHDGPTGSLLDEDGEPLDTTALEAACAELVASFGSEPIDADDEAFVDVARTWRQRSLPLAELATEAAAVAPVLEDFAEATRDGNATMRALHVAAEDGDLDEVEAALRDYRAIGSRIELEAEEHGLTGCL